MAYIITVAPLLRSSSALALPMPAQSSSSPPLGAFSDLRLSMPSSLPAATGARAIRSQAHPMLLLDPPHAPAWAGAARIVSYAGHRISSAIAFHNRLASLAAAMIQDLHEPSLPSWLPAGSAASASRPSPSLRTSSHPSLPVGFLHLHSRPPQATSRGNRAEGLGWVWLFLSAAGFGLCGSSYPLLIFSFLGLFFIFTSSPPPFRQVGFFRVS